MSFFGKPMLVYGHDAAVSHWVGEKLGISDFGLCSAIGVWRDGDIIAGCVFSQYRPPNIEISFAASTPKWATRATIREILRYPFLELGCKRVTCITEATYQRACAFLCRLGFHREGVHPDVFLSGDAITYGLLRKDADRWLAEVR